jgi:hypothetical protein
MLRFVIASPSGIGAAARPAAQPLHAVHQVGPGQPCAVAEGVCRQREHQVPGGDLDEPVPVDLEPLHSVRRGASRAGGVVDMGLDPRGPYIGDVDHGGDRDLRCVVGAPEGASSAETALSVSCSRRAQASSPEGDAYLDVPYRTLSPPISVWEQQAAVARLRELGRAEVDKNALCAMVAQNDQHRAGDRPT